MISPKYIIFSLDKQQYALEINVVERVVAAVEFTTLPKAPEIVLGVINLEGRILPVINLRKRLQLLEREIELTDQLIIARTSSRTLALVVDQVSKVIEWQENIILPQEVAPNINDIEGIIKIKGDIILIYDLDKCLSFEENATLNQALKNNL